MKDSNFTTIAVLPIDPIFGKAPTTLACAATAPLRVVVRNVGAGVIFVATAQQDVDPISGPTTGAFRIFNGAEEVFVLAPKQTLSSIAAGIGALAAVTTSEALPFDFRS